MGDRRTFPIMAISLCFTRTSEESKTFTVLILHSETSNLKPTLCNFLRVSSILRCNSSRFLDVSLSTRVCLAALITATLRTSGEDNDPPWFARTRNWDDMLVPAEKPIIHYVIKLLTVTLNMVNHHKVSTYIHKTNFKNSLNQPTDQSTNQPSNHQQTNQLIISTVCVS